MSEIPKFTFYDKDNELLIIAGMTIFIYDGQKWSNIIINDVNLPDSDFSILKKPSLSEIYQNKNSELVKVLILSGGYNSKLKSASNTIFVLNISKNDKNEKQCLLDFKYPDMKNRRFLHNSVNVSNKYIIIIGGKNENEYLSSCEYLDLEKSKWEPFPNLLEARANFSICLMNNNEIYLYGGYEKNGKFTSNLLTKCEVNLNNISESKWSNLNLNTNNINNLPLVCSTLYPNDDTIIICGGTNGENMLNGLFELDPSENNIQNLGKINSFRSSFHCFMLDGDFYAVGGFVKDFKFNDDKTIIENYIEKFTFDLNNNIESSFIKVESNDIIQPIIEHGGDVNEFKNNPGFPFNCSILTKKF